MTSSDSPQPARQKTLTPAEAREMDRCDVIPIVMDIERAHGILRIHEELGICTTEDCPRLAAAHRRIERDPHAREVIHFARPAGGNQ